MSQADGIESAYCKCGFERDDVAHRFLRCHHLGDPREELLDKLGHTDLTTLLTRDAAVATSWAIRHWGIPQFQFTKKHLPHFLFEDT